MNLLTSMLLYLIVGCGEWYLALRRTLACARGEKAVLVVIVFIENLLGLWVLSSFVRTNNWLLALSYAAGASAGALLVAMNNERSTTPAQAAEISEHLTSTSVTNNPPAIPLVRRRAGQRRISSHTTRPPCGRATTSRGLASATSL